MQHGRLELHEDPAPARWIVERIHPFAEDVGSVIPEGFAAYARLFHPAHLGDAPVRWSEVAAANGRVSHPEMQWHHISGVSVHSGASTPGLWDCEPEVGSLPLDMARLLVEALGPHTTTPELVWFAVWDGFGGLAANPEDRVVLRSKPRFDFRRHRRRTSPRAPTFALPGRTYQLFSGPVEAITESMTMPPGYQSANLWWPEDRAWCVATEIDFAWTYIGGTADVVEDVVANAEIEAMPARIDHGITYDADGLNPPPI